MSERLHYFTEATTTPVSFDCDASEIDSDLDDLRRPQTDQDRLKIHTRQLQLWSDEARRRLGASLPPSSPPSSSPRRNTFSSPANNSQRTSACTAATTDRHQSNLSERARTPRANAAAVRRSHSAKNLRIRVTPSSSSRSLLSDIESEGGGGGGGAVAAATARSAPHSPREPKSLPPMRDEKLSLGEAPLPAALVLTPSSVQPFASGEHSQLQEREHSDDSESAPLSRRQSFHRRIKRLSLRRWLRRRA